MVFRDWTRPQDYAFTGALEGAQWAWEFLRRNPRYQAEWRAFNAVWQALEAQYGRPPNRDFCAWRLDPRAWVRAEDCPQGECRIDQDRVLIECALGARWGFHKFPPDPADDDPVGGGRLVWQATEAEVPLLDSGDTDWLGENPARIALGFDLTLPLREQLEHAKRRLQVLQRQRQRSGLLQPLSLSARRAALAQQLRVLDAETAAADEAGFASIDDDWRVLLAQAHELRDGGYRGLACLPA